ncbi:MAG: hypothetical protein ACUVTZ_12980 [Armatimonadota bacterium]
MGKGSSGSAVVHWTAPVFLLIVAGILCFGAAPTALAQDIKYKAVYRDPNFHTNWNNAAVADAVTDFFKSAGYEVLDEPKLRP